MVLTQLILSIGALLVFILTLQIARSNKLREENTLQLKAFNKKLNNFIVLKELSESANALSEKVESLTKKRS